MLVMAVKLQQQLSDIPMNREQNNYEGVQKTDKILALQEELLNTRKQMSKRQSQWQKQRGTLMSKNQVNNIQIIQLKQRIINLSKINQTLTNAMTNQQQGNALENLQSNKPKKMFSTTQINQQTAEFINQNKNLNSDLTMEKNYQQIRKLTKMIAERDSQIKNLNEVICQLRSRISQRDSDVDSFKDTVHNLKCRIESKDQQILRAHKQIQQLQEKLEQNNQLAEERRHKSPLIKRKRLNIEDLQEPIDFGRRYPSKNPTYATRKSNIIDCDADDNLPYINSVEGCSSEFVSEEEQKLLCEICSKVFSFTDFDEHTKHCGYKAKNFTKQLLQKQREIESRLQQIRQEQQKQNMGSKHYSNNNLYEIQDSKSKREKIMQIREFVKGLNVSRGKVHNNVSQNFSIKSKVYN